MKTIAEIIISAFFVYGVYSALGQIKAIVRRILARVRVDKTNK